jgi:hypothetical protein
VSNNQCQKAPIHNLRANDTCWSPPAVIYFDTETRTIPNTEPQVETLRLWAATVIDRKQQRKGPMTIVNGDGDTAEELAEWITQQSKGRPTLWAYAHNLSFDLTTTRLPMTLSQHGWEITDAAVGGRAPWLRFSRGSNRLCVVDSGSWLPTKLADLGTALGIVKPPLPSGRAIRATWLSRCRADVDILSAAMQQLMGWWDREQLGRWDITGPGTGWHAFRHVPGMQPITINPSADAIGRDRRAVYGGRRGTWRIGTINDGSLLDLDFTAAYPTIAATCPLPVRRYNTFDSLSSTDWRLTSPDFGVLAECTINTETPRYPLRWGGQTWYPTGKFQTTLVGPDVAAAVRLGDLEAVGMGELHQLGRAMQGWAEWCLSVQRGDDPGTPPMARICAKAWGRSVIGKWAARGFERTDLGTSPLAGWHYEEGWDEPSQSRGGMVHMAGRRWWVSSAGDSDNAYPAILAWVESEVRTRLARAIEALGPGCVIQCDTDGFIVAADRMGRADAGGTLVCPDTIAPGARVDWCLDQLNQACAPLTLRVKHQTDTARILGPQHVDFGAQRRFSGLPATHKATGRDTYKGRIWPKLQYQMSDGDPRGYVRPETTPTIKGPYATGWITASGSVIPPMATITEDGSTTLLPWGLMPMHIQRLGLAEAQNPRLPLEHLDAHSMRAVR